METIEENTDNLKGIAIVGIAGRFPKAKNIYEFWQNLVNGKECISFFSDEELAAASIEDDFIHHPYYVKAMGVIEDMDQFDASFFGINSRDAEIMDPQHRLLLECAWEALENAGYDPENYEGAIGVFAGKSMDSYLFLNLFSHFKKVLSSRSLQAAIGNDKDSITTAISYRLNLKGPAITIQSSSSTSLVAVCVACQSLLTYQCDMALAGGITVGPPVKGGYLYEEGAIMSPDGHCRAFDASSKGFVPGNGLGLVVLKRLADAVPEGDYIWAVIKGFAVNNDGSEKVSYTAPSVDAQTEVIAEAQALAEVNPETISYIEAHGTGTNLGDPIEITALTQAFRAETDKKRYCAIGSVKTNIGHLDTAAGVAGLIKTVLALKYKKIPPSLHFEEPNPTIDFENSPFLVNNRLKEWDSGEGPRRAGVTSLGMGGTNAHVVLEEAPDITPSSPSRSWQLLLISARSVAALDVSTSHLLSYLKKQVNENLADIAYSLMIGRRAFHHRRALLCQNLEDAVTILETKNPDASFSSVCLSFNRPVVFMFPGQGSQYVNMGFDLYCQEPLFKEYFDRCAELLKPYLGLDIRELLYPGPEDIDQQGKKLEQTYITQPLLFTIEYALARVLMDWGITTAGMIGHSIGEYVAAALANCFSLEEAIKLVSLRARLIQDQERGAMLVVGLNEFEVEKVLEEGLDLAAVNSPGMCVVSGKTEMVEKLKNDLKKKDIFFKRLRTSHAFHSNMMAPVVQDFREVVSSIKLKPPKIPFISCVTGTWLTDEQAVNPGYWAEHIVKPVRFKDGIQELLCNPQFIFLEVGPGNSLCQLAAKQKVDGSVDSEVVVLSSLRHVKEKVSDIAFLLKMLAKLWVNGVTLDWKSLYKEEKRYRLPLPTYPFEGKKYWLESKEEIGDKISKVDGEPLSQGREETISIYLPVWKKVLGSFSLIVKKSLKEKKCWLILVDKTGIGKALARELLGCNQEVICVEMGKEFKTHSDNTYILDPTKRDHYRSLFRELFSLEKRPDHILHLFSLKGEKGDDKNEDLLRRSMDVGYNSLIYLSSALDEQNPPGCIRVYYITNNTHEVNSGEDFYPEKSIALSACKVIPQEYHKVTCHWVDLGLQTNKDTDTNMLSSLLLKEITRDKNEPHVVYRRKNKYVPDYDFLEPDKIGEEPGVLVKDGVYMLLNGWRGINKVLAGYLARKVQAKLVLVLKEEEMAMPHQLQEEEIKQLEKLGAQVTILVDDIHTLPGLNALIEKTRQRFGRLNGVIYTSLSHGMAPGSIDSIGNSAGAGKASSILVQMKLLSLLTEVLKKEKLDFCVFNSSLSVQLGGLGYVEHGAMDMLMDGVVIKANPDIIFPCLSVNWDAFKWEEDGQENEKAIGQGLILLPEEREYLFKFLFQLVGRASQIIITKGDLDRRLNQWIRREQKEEVCRDRRDREITTGFASEVESSQGETGRILGDIWQELLGHRPVGISDNFFESGGDSLLATQLLSRLRERFRIRFPLDMIFENPTLYSLTQQINSMLTEKKESDQIDDILKEIGNLSPSEIQDQLKKESTS